MAVKLREDEKAELKYSMGRRTFNKSYALEAKDHASHVDKRAAWKRVRRANCRRWLSSQ